jgi:hypothetical protein
MARSVPGAMSSPPVNRHDGCARSAADDDVGALLPHLLAAKSPQPAEEVLGSHRPRITPDATPVYRLDRLAPSGVEVAAEVARFSGVR